MTKYRCPHCHDILERDSDKAWITEYCDTAHKRVRLHKVTTPETALDWFHFQIKGHLTADVSAILDEAKKLERQQHGRTWDAAIQAHEDRGHVLSRSVCDFDEYVVG